MTVKKVEVAKGGILHVNSSVEVKVTSLKWGVRRRVSMLMRLRRITVMKHFFLRVSVIEVTWPLELQ